MASHDPRIDAYIEKSADFAQPILRRLREIVHAACPGVEETMKWSMPFFLHHGMLCNMAAFKQHCSFGFWRASLLGIDAKTEAAMGQFGRITRLADLPAKSVLAGYIKRAMALNEQGSKPAKAKTAAAKPVLAAPDYFLAALRKNRKAQAAFDAFSPSHRREYIEWLADAKREDTRSRRLAQAIEWLAEGKPRNWKYLDC